MAIVANTGVPAPVDVSFSSPNRTFANLAAVIAATPLYAGEIALTLDTLLKYRGLATVAGRWAQTGGKVT